MILSSGRSEKKFWWHRVSFRFESDTCTSQKQFFTTLDLRKNFSFRSTVIFMGVLSLTFSSSAYASSIAQIRDEIQISQEVALLGIALFVLGFSLSPIVFGPLVFSIGHRWTYILSYGCFTAFAFGAAEARNGASLVILRFWSGFFGGSTFNNALATVADVSVEKVRSIFRIHD